MRRIFKAITLAVAVSACAATEKGIDIPDGTYVLDFERSGCGTLTIKGSEDYVWDAACEGRDPDYTGVTRIGNRFFIGEATMDVTALTPTGFTAEFGYSGTSQTVNAVRQ
ncbi:hypothetical protein KHP62_20455 [Rhodobacteraceae bacterium NNCM2]|nr:hypothetical protein [Coraliihabitans acroporae]